MPNKDGYTKSHYWKEKGECCSSIPRTSLWHLGELRTIWQDIQQYPIAVNWKMTRPVPWFSIHGVPKCHRHLTCFANCELSILRKIHTPQNQSTKPQQKLKGWFGRQKENGVQQHFVLKKICTLPHPKRPRLCSCKFKSCKLEMCGNRKNELL